MVNPSIPSSTFSETGRFQGYEYCCELLARSIRDKTALESIISKLSEQKSETKRRNERKYGDDIRAGKFNEIEITAMINSEENVLESVIRLLSA